MNSNFPLALSQTPFTCTHASARTLSVSQTHTMACIYMQFHPRPHDLLASGFRTHVSKALSSTIRKLGAPVIAVQQQEQAFTSTKDRSRRPENAPGDFFVDHTCIDCDTCRWMAPETFNRQGGQSAVYSQPSSSSARVAALQALLSCPTSSIRTEKAPADILNVQQTFPLPIDEERLPGIYLCGYHSEKSYGATPYLLKLPDGNIMIDSPRFTERLAVHIESLGGIRMLFLTHLDDVADHGAWQRRFGCERIIHKEDVRSSTVDVETKLDGTGPWNISPGIDLIHTPGHTMGSVCLIHKPLGVLFTGDHLALADDGETLTMFRQYSKLSVAMQIESVRALLPLNFTWILPGHGRRIDFKNKEEKDRVIEEFLKTQTNS